MNKSQVWIIIAAISIILAAYFALNCLVIQGIIGCAMCCSSLVIGAWHERKEREEKENH